MRPSERGVSRREFVKAAVAIGGSAALSACLDRESPPDLQTGDPAAVPARQHAWNDALARDDHGNVRMARHHVVLLLDYADDGTPDESDRETVDTALRGLERAYQWDNEGLLFTVGYSPAYFARYDAALAGIDVPQPEALAPFEDPAPDEPDAIVHLASDYGSVVLGAEEALLGERAQLNGVDVSGLDTVFDRTDRRTGFIGAGLPAENQAVEGIPDDEPVDEDAPLFMGFKSGFEKNQASEDSVTITEGPFADGTTQHLSKITLHLDQWYEQDSRSQRVAKMFCPAHAEEDRVEGVGDNLGDSSQLGECPAHVEEDARTSGMIGHSQKAARAREDDAPRILRRDFDSTDGGQAGLHFLSIQRSITDFVETRKAMNGTDVSEDASVGTRLNNGILQYMTVERRGNYLLPPRSLRALPRPDP
ncbi:Tat pathway signal protein [Halobacteriales archaeon QS_4_62_28]|nr:MAG: Tat pathway signal protein [Halobacteriales archaeon QS_4_62_28]